MVSSKAWLLLRLGRTKNPRRGIPLRLGLNRRVANDGQQGRDYGQGNRNRRAPEGPARAADVSPIGRLLRRLLPDVLPGGRFPSRSAGRAAGTDCGLRVLYWRRPVRILASYAAHHRRGARTWLGVFRGGARGRQVPHPQPRIYRCGGRTTRRRGATGPRGVSLFKQTIPRKARGQTLRFIHTAFGSVK